MSVPAWCTWTLGTSAVLLVAPHGGRRPAVDVTALPPHLRVNDLYTPELTALLADRLDAATVINHEQDRNTLDLNRTSQVLRRAPWFLDLLAEQIEGILARHPVAELLFIHGWNVGQPKCDLGIGAVETATGLHIPDGAALTVGDDYLREHVEALRAAGIAAGIGVSIGERYPASHRNNLLQVFARRAHAADHPAAQRIAAWVAAGRINALQLEMGIPLRWPGTWRDRFIDTVAGVFVPAAGATVPPREHVTRPASHVTLTPSALQFYDPVAEVGMFAGVAPIGAHLTAGRLLLFLGGQRIALFTGENSNGGQVQPLALQVEDGGTELRFRGSLLRLDDAGVYLDLEAALAQSHIIEADVELRFTPMHAGHDQMQFGRVAGTLRIEGRSWQISTGGFANAGAFRAFGMRRQTMLAADFGDGGGLLSRSTDEASRCVALHFTSDGISTLQPTPLAVSVDGDRYTPQQFDLVCEAQPRLRADARSRMPILRPTGKGGYLRVTFGVAQFQWGARTGWGLYEHAVPLRRDAGAELGATPS